jgi:GMP synthase (glutamine-hydrolysing)
MEDMIYIFDFGSQYSQLIARRLRGLGVEVKLVPHSYSLSKLQGAKGIILSGGPDSVYAKSAATIPVKIFELVPTPDGAGLRIPVLGICYGMQLMTHILKGSVQRSEKHEYGPATLELKEENELFNGLPKSFSVWMSHGDQVIKLPNGFTQTASSSNSPNAAIENSNQKLYGIQFHPEVEHTQHGTDILSNFVFSICGCKKTNKIGDFIEQKVAEIRKTVGDNHVICATSGGVDSSVVAALLGKAIGKQLTCIFVNSGTLRKNEHKEALELLQGLKLNVRYVNAEAQFLQALKGESYGETKRKVIGKEFIRVFENKLNQLLRSWRRARFIQM